MATAPLKLLLIEDDEVDRIAVKRALRAGAVKAELEEAADFRAASAALLRREADCVLLDFHLPGGNGLELMQLARGAGVEVPIVVLTGQGDEALAVELMKAGAADYLPKKLLTWDRLNQSIRQALRIHAAEQRAQAAHAALARQAAQLQLLADSSLGIHAAVTVEETLELVARLARELTGAGIGIARLRRAPPLPVLERRSLPDDAPALPLFTEAELTHWESLVWRAERGVRLTAAELAQQPEWNTGGRLHGVLAVTMRGADRMPLGSLLLTGRTGGDFTPGDQLLLSQLARTAAVGLENSRLFAEAQAATRARDGLLAVVSHDLRSPLNIVSMSAGLLKPTLEGTPGVAMVERIERGVRAMTRLIGDLLDAASIDAGTLAVVPVRVKAAALLEDALASARLLALDPPCALTASGLDSTLEVLADPERIAQLLLNLVGNSLKFVPPEGGEIRLGLTSDADRVELSVTDNGAGIAAEDLPHVFTRYFRGATTHKGAGLGLYIARGIAHAHSGELLLDSRPGQGTTARLWLPIAR